jgi:predicted DNA-binding transcriptional regulator YafY
VLLPIESMEHGARQVLGFGAEMEVRLPLALRAEVLRLASSLKALHDRG